MNLIRNRYGRHATAWDLLDMLGVKRLPAEGMPERLIQGVRVYVKPLPPGPAKGRSRFSLRVTAICDDCGRHMAVGRMHQHVCKGAGDTP